MQLTSAHARSGKLGWRGWIDRQPWPTRALLRSEIFSFIEGFYNRFRLHSGLPGRVREEAVCHGKRSPITRFVAKPPDCPRKRGNSAWASSRPTCSSTPSCTTKSSSRSQVSVAPSPMSKTERGQPIDGGSLLPTPHGPCRQCRCGPSLQMCCTAPPVHILAAGG